MLPFATLVFDNVELSPAYRLNGRQEGFRQLFRHLLEFGRVFTCASSLSMARNHGGTPWRTHALAAAGVRRTRSAAFQQIEQMLTDMMSIYNMKLHVMLYQAALAVNSGGPARQRLSVALMTLRARRHHRGGIERHADTRRHGIHGGARVSQLWQDCRGNQIAGHRPDHGVHRLAAHHGEVLTPPRRTRKRVAGYLPAYVGRHPSFPSWFG